MRVIMTSRTDCGQLPVGGRLGGQGGRLTQEAGAAVAASQVYEKMGCAGLFTTFCTCLQRFARMAQARRDQ